ncbi:ABC transporter permease [Streptomyces boncukensis]|uniref:Transport permease protein n=1 Tax=Streptomyces boncukensis TaxID=2711219 RepID=A0A6G4WSK6_9ACTN|nr:ABC transporter permease [Streptomyces boncukensis]NGO68259.1 ABC transporter permease [Streptomyces boncukensis]
MSTPSYAMRDSMTMLRRNLKHAQRYPSMSLSTIAMPVLMLLLFNYVFGRALGDGIGGTEAGATGAGGDYIDYIAPGIILMAATSGAVATAVSICSDMTEGIVNRFRTMPISRASFLTGHVVGSVIQTMVSIACVVLVALAIGFRPNANPGEWIAAAGLLALLTLALTWLAAGIGLVTKKVETASNIPLPLTFLPFLGSAIVPPESMPSGMRWFADYQPFTPLIETLRGLLMGTGIGNDGYISVAWCLGLAVVGYVWAKRAFAKGVRN